MSKGLEALERIVDNKVFISLGRAQGKKQFANDIAIIQKELKALEIIKYKGVAVGMLQLEEVGLQEYNDFIGDKELYLTQKEYDLLKEVLK